MASLKVLMVAVALSSSALSAALSAAPANKEAEAHLSLIQFADAFDRAQLAKDHDALERMVADDLVFIDGSGKRLGKKAFIDGWTAPGDRYDPIVLIDRVVTALGPDAGIVGAETILSGTSDGQSFSSRFRFADTFRRVGGRWQAVHIQVTRLPPAKAQ
jgi:ketosteroid isomerase-like protein